MQSDLDLMRALAALMGWGEKDQGGQNTYIIRNSIVWRFDDDCWHPWCPLHSMDDALMIMRRFEAAGCAAWVECDGQTGRRGGVTTGAGRFEAEADTEARALCYAALMSQGIEVPALATREDT